MAATTPLSSPDGPDASSRASSPVDPPAPPAPRWRRSSFSTGAEATCVEVAFDGPADDPATTVLVRDSTDPDGPVLRFTADEWRVFLLGVDAGEFAAPGGPGARPPHRSSAQRAASSADDARSSTAARAAAPRASA